MKISELINHLEGIKEKHGDLPCKKDEIECTIEELDLDQHPDIDVNKNCRILESLVCAYNDDGNKENPTHVFFH